MSDQQDILPVPPPLPPPPIGERLYTPLCTGNEQLNDAVATSMQLIYHTNPLMRYFCAGSHLGPWHNTLAELFQDMSTRARADNTLSLITDFSHPQMAPQLHQVEQELLWEPTPPTTGSFVDASKYMAHILKIAWKEGLANLPPKKKPPYNVKNPRQAWEYHIQYVDNTYLAFLLTLFEEIVHCFTDCGHFYTSIEFPVSVTIYPEEQPENVAEPRKFNVYRLSQYLTDRYLNEITPDQYCSICKFGAQPLKRFRITRREPPFLVIYLDRFPNGKEKIQQEVIIDSPVQLYNFAYELDSAVLHKGSIEVGHYFTLVREESDIWVMIDDGRVLRGLRAHFAQQMLDSWSQILMYRLIGPASMLKKPIDDDDEEIQAELKKAYHGIDNNPQLDCSPRIISRGRPVKPAMLQPSSAPRIPLPEEDGDEALQELDYEIARIRKEMELTYEDYDIYSILRQHAVQYVPPVPPAHPYCGLENRALICYSNSVLQVFYTCTEIRTHLLRHGLAGPIHQLLSNLFGAMVKEFTARVAPSLNAEEGFIVPFRKVRPEFTKGAMHDAQEYLTVLLELVHQETNGAKANRERKPKDVPDFASAEEQWTFHRTFVDDSPLANLLMGQLESTLTCLTCGRQSRSWNAIWQLQLQLESEEKKQNQEGNDLSLVDCIKEFTAPETLRDDSAPTCSQCKSRQPCIKQQSICRTPHYLLVHLKRFQASGNKIHRHVNIDAKLDMAGQEFALHAAVCHRGNESWGHYYTLLCEQPDVWTQLDDENIHRLLTDEKAEEMLAPFAYLVMYKSKNTMKTA